MANDGSIHPTDDSATGDLAGIHAARAQIAAARLRREALIAAGRLPGPSADRSVSLPTTDFPGYTLLREIHRGGQGVVYQALQQSTHRKVAIKVLLEGVYASPSVQQRFEREIELVAGLRHPNVISVFHSDRTADDLRFCVMDYVRGLPLTHYVRQNPLTLEDALRLFAQVCEAVNHAHQKGVIHRDLKPSNILVDVEGTPRVLDFGLAKLLGGAQENLVSATGQMVGTLPYMSPEQTRGNPDEIDTRTDVYALGVLLYELLTGHYPYPVGGRLADVLKHIAETEPTPPSRAWTPESGVHGRLKRSRRRALADSSGSWPAMAARSGASPIDDEVQTIVLKALAKDRERRYQSAGELARDIGHYLAHEPIEAKRDSVGYVLRKQLRKYRLPAGIAAAFVMILTAGFVTSSTYWLQARAERDKARKAEQSARDEASAAVAAREQTEQVAEFQAEQLADIDAELMGVRLRQALLEEARAAMGRSKLESEAIDARAAELEDLLGGANFTNLALQTLDENIFERALKAVDEKFADQPLVQARLLQTVADTLRQLGLLDRATQPQEGALRLRRELLGNDHADTLTSINNMGFLLRAQGKLSEAEPYVREALEGRRLLGDDHPETLSSMNNMGGLLHDQGKLVEAEPYYRDALDGFRRVLGDDRPDTVQSINNMGFLLQAQGKLSEAEPYYREALERYRRVLGDDNPHTLNSINNMGFLLQAQGKLSEAEPYVREALEGRRRVLGDDHRHTLQSINNMGALLLSMGRLIEAETYFREALAGRRRVLGDEHPATLSSIHNMGGLLRSMGKPAEAEPFLREALESRHRLLGDDHPDTLRAFNNLGALLQRMGKSAEAEAYIREAMERRRRVLGINHPNTLESISNMGFVLKEQGKLSEAEPYYREALERYRRVLGDDHPNTLQSINNTGSLLKLMGNLTEAEPYLREALEGRRRVLGDDHPDTLRSINNLGGLLRSMGKLADAEPYFREALEGFRRVLGDDHLETLKSIHYLARLLGDLERLDEAEALAAEAVRGARRLLPEGHFNTGVFLETHGTSLTRLGRYAEGETELLKAHAILETALGADDKRTIQAVNTLIELYDAWHAAEPDAGYDVEAAEWRTRLAEWQASTQPAEP